jgi:thiol-disulfide isomerase/thioredoxin
MFLRTRLALLLILAAVFSQVPGEFAAVAEKAPEIRKSGVWINSPPLTLKELKGKVVILDFWAYDCPPCIEAMPHILKLNEKYQGRGMVLIGIHTPRADYERVVSNVRNAVTRMGVRYPVVIDNDHKIWDDYRCDLWPTQFVIDGSGSIRYVHGGVGRYDELDATVQRLLDEGRK